ncbi:methyl-accepting chemotaxis protein [Peribacillus glennii]|uniref:Chemotaxis protein n=1 Tax=Peribacillus glennii TaxID=2303991 RepID=A0A372L815_9BACI|nr:methyl-accepting chemotaxis protein [Peribacillus glennii]RFU61132.1 chemotaxis protein [Peribacillus glennii]
MLQFKGTLTYEAFETGNILKEERDAQRFGVAYISTATPIKENGEIIGVISSIVSNHKLDLLRSGAEELTAVSEQLSATSEQMSKVSEIVAKDLQELAEASLLLRDEIKNIERILSMIKDTAVRSRILGLNASIEAARSGEHGRGFAVVANEIKKMADSSKESVETVEPQLKEMMENLEKIISTLASISSHSQEQSAMIEEFHSSFEHIVNTASELSSKATV